MMQDWASKQFIIIMEICWKKPSMTMGIARAMEALDKKSKHLKLLSQKFSALFPKPKGKAAIDVVM